MSSKQLAKATSGFEERAKSLEINPPSPVPMPAKKRGMQGMVTLVGYCSCSKPARRQEKEDRKEAERQEG